MPYPQTKITTSMQFNISICITNSENKIESLLITKSIMINKNDLSEFQLKLFALNLIRICTLSHHNSNNSEILHIVGTVTKFYRKLT